MSCSVIFFDLIGDKFDCLLGQSIIGLYCVYVSKLSINISRNTELSQILPYFATVI